MTPDTKAEVASRLMEIQDAIGAIAVLIANDPTEIEAEPVATDDPVTCEHPEASIQEFATGQRMCMSCGTNDVRGL